MKQRITIRASYKDAQYMTKGWECEYLSGLEWGEAKAEIAWAVAGIHVAYPKADKFTLRLDNYDTGESGYFDMKPTLTDEDIQTQLSVLLNKYDENVKK